MKNYLSLLVILVVSLSASFASADPLPSEWKQVKRRVKSWSFAAYVINQGERSSAGVTYTSFEDTGSGNLNAADRRNGTDASGGRSRRDHHLADYAPGLTYNMATQKVTYTAPGSKHTVVCANVEVERDDNGILMPVKTIPTNNCKLRVQTCGDRDVPANQVCKAGSTRIVFEAH